MDKETTINKNEFSLLYSGFIITQVSKYLEYDSMWNLKQVLMENETSKNIFQEALIYMNFSGSMQQGSLISIVSFNQSFDNLVELNLFDCVNLEHAIILIGNQPFPKLQSLKIEFLVLDESHQQDPEDEDVGEMYASLGLVVKIQQYYPSLRELHIRKHLIFLSPKCLDCLLSFESLTSLSIIGSCHLTDVAFDLLVFHLKRLERINFSHSPALEKINVKSKLLTHLILSSCFNLQVVSVKKCPCLLYLDVSYCCSIIQSTINGMLNISNIFSSASSSLVYLNLSGLNQIRTVEIKCFPNLRELFLDFCLNLTTLRIAQCNKLQVVRFNFCQNLYCIVLEECKSVRQLDCSMLPALQRLIVRQCRPLTTIDVRGCENLVQVEKVKIKEKDD